LCTAANNALRLLELTGNSASPGDTADDLRLAIENYEHAMHNFVVTVSTFNKVSQYHTAANSSIVAFMQAADQHGDTPCAISVMHTPPKSLTAAPDRAALELARQQLKTSMTLEEMLLVPALAATLRAVAAQKPRRKRAPRFDWRKAQANDLD
jgi:hypothetical protein